jgi:hypothetical protein
MVKVLKTRSKNVLRRTYFSKVTTPGLFSLIFKSPLTWDRATRAHNVIAAQLSTVTMPQAKLHAAQITQALDDPQFSWIQQMNAGNWDVLDAKISNGGDFDFNNNQDVRTYHAYETQRLTHVLNYVPNPLMKKIVMKFQCYNYVIGFKIKQDNFMNDKLLIMFLEMVEKYNGYMRELQKKVNMNYYEPTFRNDIARANPVRFPPDGDNVRAGQQGNFAWDTIAPQVNNANNAPNTGYIDESIGLRDTGGAYLVNAERTKNFNLLDKYLKDKQKNYNMFKKELKTMFGKDIVIFEGICKLKIHQSSTQSYLYVPVINPLQDNLNIDVGLKFLQTVVTYDTEGCEAALATYAKKVLKNTYVILKDGQPGRKRLKYKKKYTSKYARMMSKKSYSRLRQSKYKRKAINKSLKKSSRWYIDRTSYVRDYNKWKDYRAGRIGRSQLGTIYSARTGLRISN